ncbi:MAG: hypothetical protein JWO91_3250 [Acidobacteriaceae bacterium]|nr:hypothetical protein [Acidobacteriaceae bacterium]
MTGPRPHQPLWLLIPAAVPAEGFIAQKRMRVSLIYWTFSCQSDPSGLSFFYTGLL